MQVVLLLFFSLVHLVALLLLQPFRSRAVQIQESLCGALEVLLLALVVAVEASGDPAAMSAGSSQDSGALLCAVLCCFALPCACVCLQALCCFAQCLRLPACAVSACSCCVVGSSD